MGHQGVVDSGVAGPSPGEPLEGARIVVQPKGRPAVIQLTAAKGRGSRRPHGPVPGDVLRTEVGAQRDQFREVAHRVDRADLLDAHEPVCVEVLPEK